jgi:hypothetical protein
MKSKGALKKELHQLIDSIDDEYILSILKEDLVPYLIKNRSRATSEEDLNEDQQIELNEAIAEADKEETVNYEEFKRTMSRWLTK